MKEKKELEKGQLHKNNIHKGKYDFDILVKDTPELENFIIKNLKGENTINFSDSEAVKALNKGLLKTYYKIEYWDIPEGFLCPPIPGRADYINYLSDLLNNPKEKIKVLDIGTGANCIYPIIGTQTFGWDFVASDIDSVSISTAQKIIDNNSNLKGKIKLKLQMDKNNIFTGIIGENDKFKFTMCNPPFHSSLEEAEKANLKKVNNLNKNKEIVKKAELNFGGQKGELWCNGGELLFLKKMVKDSKNFALQVEWFTTLISKGENVKPIAKLLEKLGAKAIKIINMSQGQKISRIIAWSYFE